MILWGALNSRGEVDHGLKEGVLGIRVGDSDDDIKLRVARYLDVRRDCLASLVIDRTPNGNLIVRPEAVYG